FAAEFQLRRVLVDDPAAAAVQPQIAALLKERLVALLQGADKPGDSAECLAVAQIAYHGKHFAAAAHLWAKALESDPKLGDDRQAQHRVSAARAATLAAAGKGMDKPPPDEAKPKFRRDALDWLKAELTIWGKEQPRLAIVKTLNHWLHDSDLAGIRDKAALAKLP